MSQPRIPRKSQSCSSLKIAVTIAAGFIALALPRISLSQPSTERLAQAKPWSFEISAGAELPGSDFPATAARGSLRLGLQETPIGIRLEGLFIRRSAEVPVWDGSGSFRTESITQTVVPLLLAMDVEVSGGSVLRVFPLAGYGYAPVVRTSYPQEGASRQSVSQASNVWLLGAGLRYRNFTLHQLIIGVLHAGESLYEDREFFPLLIGWRF